MDYLELVKQAQNGNAAAFGKIYDVFAGRIFRYVHVKVKNQQQAEDILQDVFIKAWKALPQFDAQKGNFSAWLYRIATNATNDYFRQIYRKPPALELNEDIGIATEIDGAEEIAKQSDIETVKKVFPLLPANYARILELRFVQDFSVKETADIMDKSQLAIRLIQHRALKKLRELASKQYGTEYQKI